MPIGFRASMASKAFDVGVSVRAKVTFIGQEEEMTDAESRRLSVVDVVKMSKAERNAHTEAEKARLVAKIEAARQRIENLKSVVRVGYGPDEHDEIDYDGFTY